MDDIFQSIRFLPLLPNIALLILVVLIVAIIVAARFMGQKILWRGLFFIGVLAFLSNPNIANITSIAKKDVVAIIIDNTSSMKASGRMNGANIAAQKLKNALSLHSNIETKTIYMDDTNNGSSLSDALNEAFNDIPKGQIGGAIYIGDGQINPIDVQKRNYPIHQILIGAQNETDQRIELINAPASAKIGTNAKFTIKVSLDGVGTNSAKIIVRNGNDDKVEVIAKTNSEIQIEVPINRRGKNNIVFEVLPITNEISTANNAIVHDIIGINESLKVLLVTGEPYEGARAWRNLLKSDPNIDLIHFTILRGPEDEDDENFTPLSLIPFPTDELFFEHLDSFDLIVFDRFKRLDALDDYYLARVAAWIERGGGFLYLAGPDEIANNGIMATSIARLMPLSGGAELIETPFKPSLTQTGLLHPITKDFADQQQSWGRWTGAIKYKANGDVLLEANGEPLLITSAAGNGRIGTILSDRSWLWQRGYEGGGPFRTLMARIIHWLLKDPDLAAENLVFSKTDSGLKITYSNIQYDNNSLELFAPNLPNQTQTAQEIALTTGANGMLEYLINDPKFGLYRARIGDASSSIIYKIKNETDRNLVALDKGIQDYFGNSQSKSRFIGLEANGELPRFAHKNGLVLDNNEWALKQNNYKSRQSIAYTPILPAWIFAILLSLLALLAWFKEGGAISRTANLGLKRSFGRAKAND